MKTHALKMSQGDKKSADQMPRKQEKGTRDEVACELKLGSKLQPCGDKDNKQYSSELLSVVLNSNYRFTWALPVTRQETLRAQARSCPLHPSSALVAVTQTGVCLTRVKGNTRLEPGSLREGQFRASSG